MVHILPAAPHGTTDQMSPGHAAVPPELVGVEGVSEPGRRIDIETASKSVSPGSSGRPGLGTHPNAQIYGTRFSWRMPLGQITERMGLRGGPRRAGRLVRSDAPCTLVSDGAERAVAQAAAAAGDGIIGVGAADIVQRCLNAGLVGEIVINLVPVLLGEGIRTGGWVVNRREGIRIDRLLRGRRASGSSELWRCKLVSWPRQHVSCLPAIFTVTAPRP